MILLIVWIVRRIRRWRRARRDVRKGLRAGAQRSRNQSVIPAKAAIQLFAKVSHPIAKLDSGLRRMTSVRELLASCMASRPPLVGEAIDDSHDRRNPPRTLRRQPRSFRRRVRNEHDSRRIRL